MEPIITSDGYKVLQNPGKARLILSDYLRKQGYTVVSPQTAGKLSGTRNSSFPEQKSALK